VVCHIRLQPGVRWFPVTVPLLICNDIVGCFTGSHIVGYVVTLTLLALLLPTVPTLFPLTPYVVVFVVI